jgi:chaperonin GroEL (HSP60 family)
LGKIAIFLNLSVFYAQNETLLFKDAIHVARNICLDPFLVPGGGAVEMEVSHHLKEKSNDIKGITQLPYREIATALEIIPKYAKVINHSLNFKSNYP